MTFPHAAHVEPTPFSVENQRLNWSVPHKVPKGGWAFKKFFADLLVDSARESGLLDALDAVRFVPSKPPRGRIIYYSNESLLRAVSLRLVEKEQYAKDFVETIKTTWQAWEVCGFEEGRTPSAATISRFTRLLSERRGLFWDTLTAVNRRITALVAKGRETGGFADNAPPVGEIIAIDSTDMESVSDFYSRPHIDPSCPKPDKPADCASDIPGCCKASDVNATWGVRTDKKSPTGVSPFFGYKLHVICDAYYGTPLYAVLLPANASDTKQLRPLVEETLKRYPWLAPKYLLADKGYDSTENFVFLDSVGIIPIIAVRRPKRTKGKRRATYEIEFEGPLGTYIQSYNVDGYPMCPCNRVMRYVGTDSERGHLFKCPRGERQLKKKLTPLSCGDEQWERPDGKLLRVMGKIPRFSKSWKELYKLRQAIERFFGSAKRSRLLNKQQYLSMDKVAIHAQISLLTYSVTMLARLMGGDYARIRLMRM